MSGCYVIFHKQLGDLLLLEPALDALRAHHGGEISIFTRGGHAPLLELMGGPLYHKSPAVRSRSHLYCFDTVRKSAWRSFITPAAQKYSILPDSTEMYWFHRYLFKETIVPGLGDQYIAEYFWENLPIPKTTEFRPPKLSKPPEDWRPNGIGSEPYILLNPTSGWRRKNWRPDGWADVARSLSAAGAPPAVMTSSTTDWQMEHCFQVQSLAGPAIQTLSEPTSSKNYLWLCANADMVLTVDGSAGHLAAAFGVPNLTVFGPTSIHNWHFPTVRNVALQAPPSRDGKVKTKNLDSGSVAAAAVALWQQQCVTAAGNLQSVDSDPRIRLSAISAPEVTNITKL